MTVPDYTAEIRSLTALFTAIGSMLSSLYAIYRGYRNRKHIERVDEKVEDHFRECRDNGQSQEEH